MRGWRLMLAAVIATVMLLAGACGGDDDSESAADTAAPTTTTTEAPTTTTTAAPTTTTTTAVTDDFEPVEPPEPGLQAPTTTTSVDDAFEELERIRESLSEGFVEFFESSEGEFDRVDLIRWDLEGTFEIEGHLKWASQDMQEDSHFSSVTFIAEVNILAMEGAGSDRAPTFLYGGDPLVSMRTVSADGDYAYSSLTDWDTLVALGKRQISFEEWKQAANAGFE